MIARTEKEIIQHWEGDLETPVVSICTITYNHEKFIEEALDSFLMQETNFPFEIVVDDDCSPDGTAEIIKKYMQQYPNIMNVRLREKNVGFMQNFLENMQRAKGKYIALCEGDDYWTDPLKLQKQVEFLEEHKEFSLVSSKVIVKTNEALKITGIAGTFNKYDVLERKVILFTSPVMFRTKNFNQDSIIFIKGMIGGDWPLFIDQLQYGKVFVMNEPMSVYRQHDGGVFSSLSILNQYIQAMKIFSEYMNMTKKFSSRDRNYIILGARKKLSQIFVLDYPHQSEEIYKVLEEYRQFLTSYEYKILKNLLPLGDWFFGRVSWRLMKLGNHFIPQIEKSYK